jgi:(4S)-4-hydroxy-5-phosphonooxypentane-2,3-dione isomerase
MIVNFVHVWVKEDHISDFIKATISNHEKSVQEAGNLRFDVLQDSNDSAKFILYEAYESDTAAAAHKNTAHYLEWREAVAGWMLKPREGVRYNIIAPAEKTRWK